MMSREIVKLRVHLSVCIAFKKSCIASFVWLSSRECNGSNSLAKLTPQRSQLYGPKIASSPKFGMTLHSSLNHR